MPVAGPVIPVADESLNAAPLYNKAAQAFEELPDDIAKLLRKKHYEVTSEEKQVLDNWLTENEESFRLVAAGSQRPYYWQHYEGEASCKRAKARAGDWKTS